MLSPRLADHLPQSAVHPERLATRLHISPDSQPDVRRVVRLASACNQHLQCPEHEHCESSHLSFRYNERPLFLSVHRKHAEAGGSPSPPCDLELSSGNEVQRLRSSRTFAEA